MVEQILKLLDENFKLTERECNEFSSLKLQGMNFENAAFYANGLGNVAVMKITTDAGVMSMDTLIINPFEIDAPMLSYDCINMQGNAILYLEPFDTTLSHNFDTSLISSVTAKYEELLENNPQQDRWYDAMRLDGTCFKKTANVELLNEMLLNYYKAFVESLKNTDKCDEKEKMEAASKYSKGLIENGGPATDPFLKAFGKETTERFFKEVLFGV